MRSSLAYVTENVFGKNSTWDKSVRIKGSTTEKNLKSLSSEILKLGKDSEEGKKKSEEFNEINSKTYTFAHKLKTLRRGMIKPLAAAYVLGTNAHRFVFAGIADTTKALTAIPARLANMTMKAMSGLVRAGLKLAIGKPKQAMGELIKTGVKMKNIATTPLWSDNGLFGDRNSNRGQIESLNRKFENGKDHRREVVKNIHSERSDKKLDRMISNLSSELEEKNRSIRTQASLSVKEEKIKSPDISSTLEFQQTKKSIKMPGIVEANTAGRVYKLANKDDRETIKKDFLQKDGLKIVLLDKKQSAEYEKASDKAEYLKKIPKEKILEGDVAKQYLSRAITLENKKENLNNEISKDRKSMKTAPDNIETKRLYMKIKNNKETRNLVQTKIKDLYKNPKAELDKIKSANLEKFEANQGKTKEKSSNMEKSQANKSSTKEKMD